jgi:hypothetical protein
MVAWRQKLKTVKGEIPNWRSRLVWEDGSKIGHKEMGVII